MSKRTEHCALSALALVVAAVLPAVSYAEDQDGPAEKTGEQIDETAGELRDGAAKGIDAARKALERTGEAVDERAKKAAEAVNGESD